MRLVHRRWCGRDPLDSQKLPVGGSLRLEAPREGRFRWSSVLQNHARLYHTSTPSRRGCNWIQRITRVSSALASALSLPRARVPYSQVCVVQGWFKFGGMEICKTRVMMEVSEQDDARKNRDFVTLGESDVAEFVTEVFLCTYEAVLGMSRIPATRWTDVGCRERCGQQSVL